MDEMRRRETIKGEDHVGSKLTEDEILEIRERASSGNRGIQAKLAREFGVCNQHISRIVNDKRWTHI